MEFQSIQLDTDIHIENIYTVHYYEYRSDFVFPGERHDFWEFQCVDKGQAQVRTDDGEHTLNRGQMIFHKPNEFHDMKAFQSTAPNIVVVSFTCHSPCMRYFENRVLTITDTERSLLGMLVAEARRCIETRLDDPYLNIMKKKEHPDFGSQQLLRLYLEEMLIYMIRRGATPKLPLPLDNFVDMKSGSAAYNKILYYMEDHIREPLTVDQICRDNLIGRSRLMQLFQEQNHCGVIEFFGRLKIEMAKQLIRENQMNFTQVSEFLGYSSIHYFSRQFKKITGMTPTEYTSSVKARSERK